MLWQCCYFCLRKKKNKAQKTTQREKAVCGAATPADRRPPIFPATRLPVCYLAAFLAVMLVARVTLFTARSSFSSNADAQAQQCVLRAVEEALCFALVKAGEQRTRAGRCRLKLKLQIYRVLTATTATAAVCAYSYSFLRTSGDEARDALHSLHLVVLRDRGQCCRKGCRSHVLDGYWLAAGRKSVIISNAAAANSVGSRRWQGWRSAGGTLSPAVFRGWGV